MKFGSEFSSPTWLGFTNNSSSTVSQAVKRVNTEIKSEILNIFFIGIFLVFSIRTVQKKKYYPAW
jgi:hypothetical protein